jgi:hypothetical protein
MSEPEEQSPKENGAPPERQRLLYSSAADSPRQARTVFFETPLARFIRAQSREKAMPV